MRNDTSAPTARRSPRLRYFALGVLVAAASFWVLMNWFEIFVTRLGVATTYDTRPVWLRAVMAGVQATPWLVLAVLIALRLRGRRSVRPLAFAAGLAAHYAAMFGFVIFGPTVEDHWHRREFESAAWRRNAGANTEWPARLTMVDDLLARHPLQGLSRDSVERLLGPRDSTEYWHEWDLVYLLGPERGLISMDSEWLVARLGPDGRVVEYRIVRD